MLKDFLESRLSKWRKLEELTARASKYRLTNLSGEEVREFGRLYRRTAADLAVAREEVRDQRLVNYLNHLVARAHGAIYRTESSGFGVFASFFKREFPRVFRITFPYTFAAFLIFMLAGAFAAAISVADEQFADHIDPGLRNNIASHIDWTQRINEANPSVTTGIQTNNITVTFMAFGGGVFVGLGTLYALVYNGLLFGMVMGLCFKHQFWTIPIFVSGHGVIELTAIFIAGGAGFLIGKALLIPGDMRRIDALVTNGLLAIKLMLGTIPMLLVAGLIEGFISPAHIAPVYKLSVSLLTALLMVLYFGVAGRDETREDEKVKPATAR
ncbi:MAG TPA: stage II sporulation protein M [Blastocatellia bacterium]|jgi:uncharacterized membrane protein SpoIIM required for sporulation